VFKLTFLKLYFAAGLVTVVLFALADATGALAPRFGPQGDVDTSSRQGYWYTYQRPKYNSYGSSPGRSPGSGGGYGGGGYSGGK
jgi:hypothetical protein